MLTLVFVVGLALCFDFINGFHDAANSIATVVSTRVLSPRRAVVWAAFFNFVAFLVFNTHVAGNIAKGVDAHVVTVPLVAAGLLGAIVWDLLTWWWGLPTSSSHALLGGLAGAAVVARGLPTRSLAAGLSALDLSFFGKTALFIVVSPVLGAVLGFLAMALVMLLFGRRTPRSIDKNFRRLQLVSAAMYSLGHGGNDAQKTMGIIVMALASQGVLVAKVPGHSIGIPFWVVIACHCAMGLGTLSGGWRIVQTMGDEDHASCSPSAGSAPRRAARSPSFWRPRWASPSRPRRRSPEPSSASAACASCRRSAGASRGGSSGRGC